MGFSKGQSGNPAGRPRGIQDRRLALQQMFEPYAKDLVAKAIDMALQGDGAVMRACLDRICPPIKARGEPVELTQAGGSLADHGRGIIEALCAGRLTPDEAASMLQAIAAQVRIVEADELERRLSALEARHGKQS